MAVCDHCHVARAVTLWANVDHLDHADELDLCGHASDQHADALTRQGWALIEDERVEQLATAGARSAP